MKQIKDFKKEMEFIKDYYSSELKKKKTNASKKTFLTKSLMKANQYLLDQVEAQKHPSGFLHGERVKNSDILRTKGELNIIRELYNSIN